MDIRGFLTSPEHPESAQESLQICWVFQSKQIAHFSSGLGHSVFNSLKFMCVASCLFTRKLDVLCVSPATIKRNEIKP